MATYKIKLTNETETALKEMQASSGNDNLEFSKYLEYLLTKYPDIHTPILSLSDVGIEILDELNRTVELYAFFAAHSDDDRISQHYNEFRKTYDKKLNILLSNIETPSITE